MSRNRKNHTSAVRFGPAFKAFAICLFLGSSGVGYVWQKEQINVLAEQIRQAEIRYEKLRRQNDRFARALAMLQSPNELEARIKKNEMGMVAPQPDQIIRLYEWTPVAEAPSPVNPRLYAAQQLNDVSQR